MNFHSTSLREQYSCKMVLEHIPMISADYYYVMTFLQTSSQFVSPTGALIDKVSLSFHF
jgi:hypothetical protein